MKRITRHSLTVLSMLCGIASLHAQMIIKSPKRNEVVEKDRIAVIVVGRAGSRARLFVNNVPADSGEIRIDGKYDFLNVPVPEGPVMLRAEAIGAGNRLFSAECPVHIVGRPSKIVPDKKSVEMPADSQSVQSVNVRVEDAWGHPIGLLKTITVLIQKGRVASEDLDSLSTGWQVPVQNGLAEIPIRAAGAVGSEDVSIRAGNTVLTLPFRYTTPETEFILVGSLDAAASAAELGVKDHGAPKFTLADYTHQEGVIGNIPISGRLALYAKGSVAKKYQVTASYDSRRTLDNQLFRDLDPDKQYALYGDASTLTYDALTQSKFFGRIERNESFLSLGDFNTNLRSTDFAKYDRSFTGLYGKWQTGRQAVTGFATLNDRTMQMDEIRGEGISGYYTLSASRITLNSDKIRIETRDRYHPEKILRSEEQVRYQDYDINYVDGTLMFKQPVPSVDAEGNPVTIVASYEYQAQNAQSLIGGLRFDGTVGKSMKLGSTLIVEGKKPSNYMLYGVDATLPIRKWLQVKGEFAQTRSSDFSSDEQVGNAYSAEAELKPNRSLKMSGYCRRVESDFMNTSQTGSRFDVGAEKVGTAQSLDMGRIGKIQSEFYRQLNEQGTVNAYRIQVANAFYEYAISNRTSAKLGYEDAERQKTGVDSVEVRSYRSKMIKGQVSHRWNKRLSTTLEHEQNLAKGETTLPTGSSVGLSYRITERVDFFLKQRLLETGKRRMQTILGIDSRVNKTTQVSGKYEIGGASGESLSRATIGLKNKWEVRKDLTLNVALESTATMDSLEVLTPDHSAVSVGIEYLPDKPVKMSGKVEMRRDDIVRRQVVSFGSEFKLWNGLSGIIRLEDTRAKYLKSSGDIWNRGQYQLGAAYRPELSDAFNGIAKVQYLTDKNTHVAPGMRLDRLIVSAHGYWQASRRLEFGMRFALRQLLDEEMGLFHSRTTTSLYSVRTVVDWTRQWSTGLDLRLVRLTPIHQNQAGIAGDVNYAIKRNMLVGIGYIFKQLGDPDFSYLEYTYSNFYLVLRMKFSEDVFDWR